MAKVFTREHLLNVAVNVVPLLIIAFFVAVYVVVRPWGVDPFDTVLMLGLHAVPLVLLAVVSYLAVKHVEIDEPREAIGEQGEFDEPTEEIATQRHREEEGVHAGEDRE